VEKDGDTEGNVECTRNGRAGAMNELVKEMYKSKGDICALQEI
jgi:hypothetical protein